MSNHKKTSKIKLEKNKFSSIPNRILYHKTLSSNAIRILGFMMTQSDDYNLNYTDMMTKLNIKRFQFDSAIKELKDTGHLSTTKGKYRGQFYTICQYGKLKQKEKQLPTDTVQDYIQNNMNDMIKYTNEDIIMDYLTTGISVEEIETNFNKIKKDFQDTFYKECFNMVRNFEGGTKTAQKAFKGWLHQKIKQEGVTKISENGGRFYPPSQWARYKQMYKPVQHMNAEDKAQAMSEQEQ